MIKNLFLCFIALWIGSLLSSCQKGEPIVETEELARIAFRSYSTASVDVKRVTIDGKVANPSDANFIFIRNKDADSSSVVAYNSNDQVVLEQRLPLKSGLNTFGVHSKSPIDPSLVVGPNPLGDDVESIPACEASKDLKL